MCNTINHETLPNELWIHIFDFIDSPNDLAPLLLTCRRFHALALRPLYRCVQWIHPLHTADNLVVWEQQEQRLLQRQVGGGMNEEVEEGRDHTASHSITDVPRSLTVAHHNGFAEDDITHLHHGGLLGGATEGGAEDGQEGYIVYPQPPSFHAILATMEAMGMGIGVDVGGNPGTVRGGHPFCISTQLMGSRISSFSRLQVLRFFDATLPESVYRAIFALPQLNCLEIEYCTLPALAYSDALLSAFSDLPMKEVTLKCFSYMYSKHLAVNMLLTPYLLCTAKGVKVMKIDWTRKAAAFFSHGDSAVGYEYVLPEGLVDVEIRLPHEHLWPKQDLMSRRLYTDALALFLLRSPTITRLTLIGKLHAFHISPTALPRLTHVHAPLEAVLCLIGGGRELAEVFVSDALRYHQPFTTCMEALEMGCPRLKSLGFLLPAWEDEVLFVVSNKFVQLRELCITYVVGNPSEQTILSLAHNFLQNFPALETVRVFKPILIRELNQHIGQSRNLDREIYTLHDENMGPGAGLEEDVKEYIMAWKKPCPRIREVQFEYGKVWRRGVGIRGGWICEPTDEAGGGVKRVTEAMELKWGMSS